MYCVSPLVSTLTTRCRRRLYLESDFVHLKIKFGKNNLPHFSNLFFFFLFIFFQIVLVYCLTGINSQLGPIPQRLAISGALPTQVRQPLPQYRNERLVAGGVPSGGFLRARRPVLGTAPPRPNTLQPFQTPNSLNEEAKPVTEENESAETPAFIPQQPYIPQIQPQLQTLQSLQALQHQPQFKQPLPSVLYTTNENGEVFDHNRPIVDYTTQRLLHQPEILPTTVRTTGNAQRFVLNHDHPVQSALQGTTKPPVSLNRHFLTII